MPILDPFRHIASAMSRTEETSVWEEEPVDVETFITDKHFLNQRWNGKTGCRPKILEIIKNVARDEVREAMLLLGKGSGKDYACAILHLYGIYRALCLYDPQTYYGLSPGSPIYFTNVARNENQARHVFFAQFQGLLDLCPWFRGKHSGPSATKVTFNKGIVALSGNSQAFGWLGFNTLQWVGDELAFFLENDENEDSNSKAEECWEAAYGSCQTRFKNHYKMIGITTPRYDDDFVMKKFYELSERNGGYAVQAATWDVNPNLTKEDFKHALARNYRRTMRDFGAMPMGVIESFWGEADFVEMNVCQTCLACPVYMTRETCTDDYACREYTDCKANPYIGNGNWADWFVPVDGAEYYMHFDLSKNKDRLGFAMSHEAGTVKIELDEFEIKEREQKENKDDRLSDEDRYIEKSLVKIDALGWIDPRRVEDTDMLKNREIHYDSVLRKLILALKDKGFNVVGVTFDQFQSLYIKQQLEDKGYVVELLSTDRTDEIPIQAKRAFTENRVEYPYCRILCTEAKKLKYVRGKKVDHVEKGSKDMFDSVACVIHSCEKNAMGGGCFVPISSNED